MQRGEVFRCQYYGIQGFLEVTGGEWDDLEDDSFVGLGLLNSM